MSISIKSKEFLEKVVECLNFSHFILDYFQEILDDLIVYQHNGRATYGDRLTIQVSDGDFTDTSALEIVIGLVDDETPRLAINRGLMLKAGNFHTGESRC